MKTLATMVIAVALALAAVPAMNAADEHDSPLPPEVIAMVKEARGIDLTDWDYEVMEFQFELPALAAGFEATFDWSSMELSVKPVETVPIGGGGGGADCVTTAADWLDTTPFSCAPELHAGSIDSTTLVCMGGAGCWVDTLDYYLFAYWLAICSGELVVGSDGHPGWTPAHGTCYVLYDSFGLPGHFQMWDAFVGTWGGVAYAAHN